MGICMYGYVWANIHPYLFPRFNLMHVGHSRGRCRTVSEVTGPVLPVPLRCRHSETFFVGLYAFDDPGREHEHAKTREAKKLQETLN